MLERVLQTPSIGVDRLSRMPSPSASSAPKELTASAGKGKRAMRPCLTAGLEAAEELLVCLPEIELLLSGKMAEGTFAKRGRAVLYGIPKDK
jgi:hypothetical protein